MSSFITFAARLQDQGITELNISLYVDPKTKMRMMLVRPRDMVTCMETPNCQRPFDLSGEDPYFEALMMELAIASFSEEAMKAALKDHPRYADEIQEYAKAFAASDEPDPEEELDQVEEKTVSSLYLQAKYTMRGIAIAESRAALKKST